MELGLLEKVGQEMLGSHELAEADAEQALAIAQQWPSGCGIGRDHCSQLFNETGVIYAIFHFTTGRFSVGQTITRIWNSIFGLGEPS